MIKILIFEENPRILYVCKLIFECVFQISYEMHEKEIPFIEKDDFIINYSHLPSFSHLQIPNDGFLAEKKIQMNRIKERDVLIKAANIAEKNVLHTTKKFSYDIFSLVFFFTSHYDKYVYSFKDKFDRYETKKYASAKGNMSEVPSVHLWCEQILACLPVTLQNEILSKRKYNYAITWDIDHPWKYINKHRFLLGFFKDTIKGEWGNIQERVAILFSNKKDPNDTFEKIRQISPPDKTTFFFLLGKGKPHDSLFGAENPAFQTLIRDTYKHGFQVGIHPSFHSYLDKEKIQQEKKSLEDIIQDEVRVSRQHFLRYRFPDTFRHLAAAGIQKDYSLCHIDEIGFPCGMACPFPWYDLEKEEITDLWLHPAMTMDRSLERYISGTLESKLQKLDAAIALSQKVGGTFTLILHNDSLSESGEWRGWSEIIQSIIQKVAKG